MSMVPTYIQVNVVVVEQGGGGVGKGWLGVVIGVWSISDSGTL